MNPGVFGFPKRGAVDLLRFGATQVLTTLQRLTALGNIGGVSYADAQGLARAQRDQGRANLLAAGLGRSIAEELLNTNASFALSQERGTSAVNSGAGSAVYCIDGVRSGAYNGATAVASMQQVVSPFSGNAGFRRVSHALRATVGTAQASFTTTQEAQCFDIPIEGSYFASMGWGTADAQDLVIILPAAAASVAGTYTIAVRNAALDRSYVTTITLGTSPGAFLVRVPGDTTGTWPTGNVQAVSVSIATVSGPTAQASTLNAWAAGNFISHSTATNWLATNSNTVTIGGALVLPASACPWASSAELVGDALALVHAIRRPPDRDVALARRYWYRINQASIGFPARVVNQIGSTLALGFGAQHPVQMRATPTMSLVWEINDVVQGSAPAFLVANIDAWDAAPSIPGNGLVDVTQVTGNARM